MISPWTTLAFSVGMIVWWSWSLTLSMAFMPGSSSIRRLQTFDVSSVITTPMDTRLCMVDGGDWDDAFREAGGSDPGAFERELEAQATASSSTKKSFLKGSKVDDLTARKIAANRNLLEFLEREGEVYLDDRSTWGQAPHPMAISTDTTDEVTNESTGRGLLARRDINEGDLLLQIPLRLCLTLNTARETLGAAAVPPGTNEYLAVALLMIYERYGEGSTSGKGGKGKSFWSAYLDVLPSTEEVSPTFTWSDEDLEALEGSPVVAATRSLQAKLRREYEAIFEGDDGLFARSSPSSPWSSKFPTTFTPEVYTFERWVWAFTMLFSRAIRLRSLKDGEALAMVPYADLINHSPFSGAYIDGRAMGDWLFKTGEEEVILFADRGYRRMEQIYISYGPKSNADLLLLYGFALERNPFNSVDVSVSIGDGDDDPLAEEKRAFLRTAGRSDLVDFPCYADRYPVEMLEYLRLMQMTKEDTGGRPLGEFDYSRVISSANEAAVLNSVMDAIKRQLTNYPTTEEQDAAIISDKSLFRLLNYNQRMSIRHRRNEKRLLKRTLAAMEKQRRAMGLEIEENNTRAQGNTMGTSSRKKSSLEERLEKMGLPVDIR